MPNLFRAIDLVSKDEIVLLSSYVEAVTFSAAAKEPISRAKTMVGNWFGDKDKPKQTPQTIQSKLDEIRLMLERMSVESLRQRL
jgi:hypothetical protein